MIELLDIALSIAEKAHEGQLRKFTKEPYIIHPKSVAARLKKEYPNRNDVEILGLLHDVLEDSDFTEQDLWDRGIPEWITVTLNILSHQEGENYVDYIFKISDSHIARRVKLADLEDNMSDLKECSLKDKYRFAYYYLTERENSENAAKKKK